MRTGIVRQLDLLGRITIPKEMRRSLGIDINDPLEISLNSTDIVLSKFETSCKLCGSKEDLVENNGKYVCRECLDRFNLIAGFKEV